MPGVDEDLGPEVGEPPRDRRGGVDDRRDLGGDERVGGGAVEVELVEHGDVAALQAAQQGVGVPVDAGDAGDPRQLGPGAVQQTGELHARTVTPIAGHAGEPRRKVTGA